MAGIIFVHKKLYYNNNLDLALVNQITQIIEAGKHIRFTYYNNVTLITEWSD